MISGLKEIQGEGKKRQKGCGILKRKGEGPFYSIFLSLRCGRRRNLGDGERKRPSFFSPEAFPLSQRGMGKGAVIVMVMGRRRERGERENASFLLPPSQDSSLKVVSSTIPGKPNSLVLGWDDSRETGGKRDPWLQVVFWDGLRGRKRREEKALSEFRCFIKC